MTLIGTAGKAGREAAPAPVSPRPLSESRPCPRCGVPTCVDDAGVSVCVACDTRPLSVRVPRYTGRDRGAIQSVSRQDGAYATGDGGYVSGHGRGLVSLPHDERQRELDTENRRADRERFGSARVCPTCVESARGFGARHGVTTDHVWRLVERKRVRVTRAPTGDRWEYVSEARHDAPPTWLPRPITLPLHEALTVSAECRVCGRDWIDEARTEYRATDAAPVSYQSQGRLTPREVRLSAQATGQRVASVAGHVAAGDSTRQARRRAQSAARSEARHAAMQGRSVDATANLVRGYGVSEVLPGHKVATARQTQGSEWEHVSVPTARLMRDPIGRTPDRGSSSWRARVHGEREIDTPSYALHGRVYGPAWRRTRAGTRSAQNARYSARAAMLSRFTG